MPRTTDMSKKSKLGILVSSKINEMGITQNRFAMKAGLTAAHLSNVLNGKQNPTLKALQRISNVSGISLEELVSTIQEDTN